jgi:predicted transcriptional regulator
MNAKRNKDDIKSTAIKKKRRVISLEDTLHMISKYEAGITIVKIAREYSLNESTVRHILDHAANYKQLGQSVSTSSGSRTTKNRSHLMIEMETLLSVWMKDCNQKRIALRQMTVKTKAFNLFETLKRKQLESENDSASVVEETFSASSGWFDRFKKRSGVHSVRVQGEIVSADEKAAAI